MLVSRVNGPGQRVDEAVFLDQVSKGPLVGPSGLTYGVIPAVPEGHLDEEQREAPDLLARLDPNGTQTIVGFMLKAEYYDALTVSGDRTLYAIDGKTVVGVRRQLASAGGQISFRFESAER